MIMTIETANRLYELRKQQGLSQEELAEKLGVSRQAVSKWERSEASPDTDNLIALAKIYGLSLDELIYGKKDEDGSSEAENKAEPEKVGDKDDAKKNIKISPCGIYIDDGDGEKIKIDLSGIHIKSSRDDDDDKDENEEIKIDLNGIHIKSSRDDDDDCDDDRDDDGIVIVDTDGKNEIKITKKKSKVKFWLEIPYAVICAVAYLFFGFTNSFGGWSASWIIFLTIPVYYSLVEAIYNRRFSDFSYSTLTAFLYLYFGMYLGNWHPSWLIFLTVAIYHPIASALDEKIAAARKNKSE